MNRPSQTFERSEEAKSLIRSLWSPPVVIDGFLTDDELSALQEKLRSTGAVDNHGSDRKNELVVTAPRPSELPLFFQRKIRRLIKNFRIRGLFAFDSNTPFMLHTDAGMDSNVIPYKNFTFCLGENTFDEQLILYNARSYFSVSVNNLKDYVYSESVVRNYKYISMTPEQFVASENVVMDPQAKEIVTGDEREFLIRHIDPALRPAFKIVDKIRFEKNRMIVFDSCQLHSGSSLQPVQMQGQSKRMILFTEYVP